MTTRDRITQIVEQIEEEHGQYVIDWHRALSARIRNDVSVAHGERRAQLIDELVALVGAS